MSMLVGSSHDMSLSAFCVMMTSHMELLCDEHNGCGSSRSGSTDAILARDGGSCRLPCQTSITSISSHIHNTLSLPAYCIEVAARDSIASLIRALAHCTTVLAIAERTGNIEGSSIVSCSRRAFQRSFIVLASALSATT